MRFVSIPAWIAALALQCSGAQEVRNPNAFTPQEMATFVNIGFFISGGSINVNAMGGWADGEYSLQEVRIDPLATINAYNAELTFSKKKGSLRYEHTESVGILCDGRRLWIKYRDRIYRYSVPSASIAVDKQANTYVSEKRNPVLDIEMENLKLRFEF